MLKIKPRCKMVYHPRAALTSSYSVTVPVHSMDITHSASVREENLAHTLSRAPRQDSALIQDSRNHLCPQLKVP